LKPTARIDPFDAALFAFELRFEQDLNSHWDELEYEAQYEISATPSGSEKGSLLSRFFSDAGDRLANIIHLHFSKLMGVATASRGRFRNQSPLGWTSSQVRRNVYSFLAMEERVDPDSPQREDSRVLNTALRISTNALPWDESSIPSRLPAWAGSQWSMRVAMSRSKKEDLSWADAEPLSLAETQEWAKFRECEIYRKIEKQIQSDGYDGVIEAGARGISVVQPVEARNSSARRKKRDLTRYLVGAGLTDRQYECISLRLEYGLNQSQIARRLGITRKTVIEHITAAEIKLERQGGKEKSDRNFAKTNPGESRRRD